MKPLISVIIPVYNVEKYLKKCLDSVINQTYKNLEIILIDDGSTDNSGKICDEYGKKDDRIIVIHMKNSGVSSARNKGLEIATGQYIGFVDSDDYIEKNMYQECSKIIFQQKNIDILKVATKIVYGKYTKKSKYDIEGLINKDEYKNKIYKRLINLYSFRNIWTCIIKRDIIKSIKFNTNLKFAEDYLFFIEVLFNSQNIYINNNCYYYYFENSESIIHKYDEGKFKENLKTRIYAYNRIIELFEKNNLNEYIDDIYVNLFKNIKNIYKVFAINNNYINYRKIVKEITESREWRGLTENTKINTDKITTNTLLFFYKYRLIGQIKKIVKKIIRKK